MARGKAEKPFTKENAKEMGSKGGKARTGYRSLKSIMKEILESGDIDPKQFVKAQMIHAMKGNSGLAKIMWEYHDGKVKDEIELNGNMQTDTTLSIKDYKKVREEMIKKDDV